MPSTWIRENLSLTNLFVLAIGLIGFGFYFRGEQLENRIINQEIATLKTAIKNIEERTNSVSIQWATISAQMAFMQQQLEELKKEVQATRRAVQ